MSSTVDSKNSNPWVTSKLKLNSWKSNSSSWTPKSSLLLKKCPKMETHSQKEMLSMSVKIRFLMLLTTHKKNSRRLNSLKYSKPNSISLKPKLSWQAKAPLVQVTTQSNLPNKQVLLQAQFYSQSQRKMSTLHNNCSMMYWQKKKIKL